MDESLYDEFGNYVGPELSGSEVRGEGDWEPVVDVCSRACPYGIGAA